MRLAPREGYGRRENPYPTKKEIAMLVLRRKERQTVVINDSILIHVNEIRGKRVAIAIDAPDGIPIRRGELLDRRDSPTSSAVGSRRAACK